MALGHSESTSSSVTAAGATDTASPSSSPSSPPGGNMQRGANYFFGFLITFIALLLIFVGCGVGTRRRFAQRQRLLMMAGVDDWVDLLGAESVVKQKEPTFWEPWLKPGSDKWCSMLPLSISPMWPPEIEFKMNNPSVESINQPSTPVHRFNLPESFPFFRRRRRTQEETGQQADARSKIPEDPLPHPESLQLSFMIEMPTPLDRRKAGDDELREYQIGVAKVPWDNPLPTLPQR